MTGTVQYPEYESDTHNRNFYFLKGEAAREEDYEKAREMGFCHFGGFLSFSENERFVTLNDLETHVKLFLSLPPGTVDDIPESLIGKWLFPQVEVPAGKYSRLTDIGRHCDMDFFYSVRNDIVDDIIPVSHEGISLITDAMAGTGPFAMAAWLKKVFVAREFEAEHLNSMIWEKLLDLKLTDRAIALRMVFAELARIKSHLVSFARLAAEFENEFLNWFSFTEINRICGLMESYSETFNRAAIAHPGGLWTDARQGWVTTSLEELGRLAENMKRQEGLLLRNPGLFGSTDGCRLRGRDLLDFGVSGPVLRAGGINFDLRKRRPYYFYSDVDFNIPLGVEGTTYDRVVVRLLEIHQSVQILSQVLDNLPVGPVADRENLEKLRQYSMNGELSVADGIHGCEYEGAEGLTGIFVKINQGRITSVQLKTPGPPHLMAYCKLMRGNTLVDAMNAYPSFNLYQSELES